MDMSQYRELFISEAGEHLQKLSALVVQLEADRDNREIIDALFRSAHSVKGMAASMGFTGMTALAHRMEDLMDRIRRGMAFDAELFDLLLAGEERLAAMLEQIAAGGSEMAADDIIARLAAYTPARGGEPAAAAGQEAAVAAPAEPVPEMRASDIQHQSPAAQQTIKVKTAALDSFLDTTGELITVKHRLALLARTLRNQDFHEAVNALEKHLRELHDQVMAVRMIPLAAVTERFPRLVRDLARNSDKEIIFTLKGVEIELDRSILELLGDPLAHLLRNCVDHGIETSAERIAAGKPASGRVEIAVSRETDQVAIRLEDDGRGIDAEQIAAAAVQQGFISREKAAALQIEEKLLLICHAGFSTAARVTEISGRGVGMDVVRTNIQSLGGTLSISSVPGQSSCFLLRLPLTIAIINVLLVKVGRFTLAIPLTAVSRTLDLLRGDIAVIDDQEAIFLESEMVPLFHLGRCLNLQTEAPRGDRVPLFITEHKGRRVALQVDTLLGNQDVFVKPLSRPLAVIEGLYGATVLGDGEVVFIVDILNRLL
ncbi:MAG: CheA signal transduction histidine kinase [Deltaproteobacteria bacterium]|nr:CheA signal transduction histidine kinase [Deltaproteobacteria bacterium]